ncbi:MAG: GGDEF domain-containing protein [Tissierellaceae bacterium]|nr:GGDEF domain-containing protein [Tissierellaceae bacterium]
MLDIITLETIEEHLAFFHKMYDVVRIVDPLHKRVLDQSGSSVTQTDKICFNYWEDGRICDNCISIRTYKENKTFMKLEHNDSTTMLVTAVPIDNTKTPTVIELLKNATDTMFVGEGNYNEGRTIREVVDGLNQKVVKDSLTSLYNRRFIYERLPADIIKATVEDSALTLIFMDIDDLKDINDVYGHNVGDYVLKEVGRAILGCIRNKSDWSARYGGDEFLICLNNANYEKAQIVSDRIQESIGEIVIPEDKSIKLKVSIGIHTMKDMKLTAEELINEADKKMYEAKRKRKKEIR